MIKEIVVCIICYNYLVNLGDGSIAQEFYDKFHQNDYKVKFERADISYVNKSLAFASMVNFPHNRTTRACNATFGLYHDYNETAIQVEFQAYKFLSNEYRVFPAHFQLDLCKALKENVAGSNSVFHCGNFTTCPFLKNTTYYTCNNVLDETHYPPFIPNGRFKLELKIYAEPYTLLKIDYYASVYRILKPGQSAGRD